MDPGQLKDFLGCIDLAFRRWRYRKRDMVVDTTSLETEDMVAWELRVIVVLVVISWPQLGIFEARLSLSLKAEPKDLNWIHLSIPEVHWPVALALDVQVLTRVLCQRQLQHTTRFWLSVVSFCLLLSPKKTYLESTHHLSGAVGCELRFG
jgi:hypothetical protein